MRVCNGYLGPCGQTRRSQSRKAVETGLHADGEDPKPLLDTLSEPHGTPIQKLLLSVKVGISNKLPIGGNRCMRLRDDTPGSGAPVSPNPGTHGKGGAQEFAPVRGVWSVEASESDHPRKRRR